MDAETFAAEHGLDVVEASIVLAVLDPIDAAEYAVESRGLSGAELRRLAVEHVRRCWERGR